MVFLVEMVVYGSVLLQSLDATDITQLMSAENLTTSGLLLIAIIMLWRKLVAAEEDNKLLRKEFSDKIESLRKEREDDNERYITILMNTTKVIDENTRVFARLEKILDK